MWRFCTSIMVRNTGLEGLLSHVRDQGSEKDGGVRFVLSHSSGLSAVEGSAFFRLDEWGSAVLGYFMTGPPARC
jgi:hypothetical protein